MSPRPSSGPARRLLIPLLALLAACAPLPPRDGIRQVPSPNFDARRPNFVILHQTSSDDSARALATLTDPQRKVSAHYLIARDGTRYQLVDEDRRAWHAGRSAWGGLTDLNSASIGIELDNTGDEPFPPAQIAALIDLLEQVLPRHQIPRGNILGHGDIAPGRKVDPSRHFPWHQLAQRGLGRWCPTPSIPPTAPPPALDPLLGLRALGYDTSRPEAAIAAFRRHFLGDEGSDLGPDGLRVLACLLHSDGDAGRTPAGPPPP